EALRRAVQNEHSIAMNVLIRSVRSQEINRYGWAGTFQIALYSLRLNLIKDLVDALGLEQFSEAAFVGALSAAAGSEGPSGPFADLIPHPPYRINRPEISRRILPILIRSPRFQQARNITRQHALAIALKAGETEKAQMLTDAGVRLPFMEYLP